MWPQKPILRFCLYFKIFSIYLWLVKRVMYEETNVEIEEEGEHQEEEEGDPVFVLTDEWKEFFAKSEAKRRIGRSHLVLCFFSSRISVLFLNYGA